ncbi:MAG TPA: hypothetical protein VN540_04025 [Clostridia bacterium]|nr:hypothetical protein [Clostridia bacterium]
MERRLIESADGLADLVEELSFIPFLESPVEGFTLKPYVPRDRWFSDGIDGPWEWKGRHIGRYAYGKLFHGYAGFVSREYLPLFVSLRRDGYDFEGYYEDGHASYKAKRIVDALAERGPMLSTELKRACGFGKGGESGFDAEIARLQMSTFVTTAGFEYALDKSGRPYGWGLARYALTEHVFGEDLMRAAEEIPPKEAKNRLFARARELCPQAEEKALERLIRA